MAAGFPACKADGHHPINRSKATALYLEVGTRAETEVAHDSDIDLMARKENGRFVFTAQEWRALSMTRVPRAAKAPLLGVIALYRWTISPLFGVNCRHLPSCSDYASEAIDRNGPWKGGWLTLARFSRCHPWGSHGLIRSPTSAASTTRSPLGAMGGGAYQGLVRRSRA